jgi:hypothetical protein
MHRAALLAAKLELTGLDIPIQQAATLEGSKTRC